AALPGVRVATASRPLNCWRLIWSLSPNRSSTSRRSGGGSSTTSSAPWRRATRARRATSSTTARSPSDSRPASQCTRLAPPIRTCSATSRHNAPSSSLVSGRRRRTSTRRVRGSDTVDLLVVGGPTSDMTPRGRATHRAPTARREPERPGDRDTGGMTERNVLGGELEECSRDPLTGFYRDGCCNTFGDERVVHTICAVVTEEFLSHQRSIGNDLSTPMPQYGFPGLKPG